MRGMLCFISRFLTFSKGPLSRSGALKLTGTLQWDTAISFFICCHFLFVLSLERAKERADVVDRIIFR